MKTLHILLSLLLFILIINVASAEYLNESFSSSKQITITTNGTSTPANYQVQLNISYESEMQADFDDIRFTNSSNGTIAYWIESKVNSSYANVWVNLSDAITDPGSDTIWMYYGNPGLSDEGNGYAIFPFFEPFDSASINTTNWPSIDGNPTYSIDSTNHYIEVTNSNVGWWTGVGFHSKIFTYPSLWIIEDAYSTDGFNYYQYASSASRSDYFVIFSAAHTDWSSTDRGVAHYRVWDDSSSNYDLNTYAGVGGNDDYDSSSFSPSRPYQNLIKMWKADGNIHITEGVNERVNEANIETPDRIHMGIARYTDKTWGTIRIHAFKMRIYITNEPTPSYGTAQHYTDSLHYNSTLPYNFTIESDGTITSNRTITAADDTNDTALSTGTSHLILNVYNNSATIVRNFTFTGDNLDWYRAANLSGMYELKNSSGTIETQFNGNFTTNLTAGTYWIEEISFSSSKQITITTNGTSTPANYQVLLNISYEAEMQADFDDIRFTNSSNGTIAYWIESIVDSSYALVWVSLSDAITDPGSDTIWMYYGNSELRDSGNGGDTFEFFDDGENDISVIFGFFGSSEYRADTGSLTQINDAVSDFNSWNVDFVIEDGDFVYGSPRNHDQMLSDLDDVEGSYDNLTMDRYYVFGNHDLDNITKSEFMNHTGKSEKYHSFDVGAYHFIVLDDMYDVSGNDLDSHGENNPDRYISDTEKTWLENDLAGTSKKTFIFTEAHLYGQSATQNIQNAAAIRTILENSSKVIACFASHAGVNDLDTVNGIDYYAMKDMRSSTPNAYAKIIIYDDDTISIEGIGEQSSYSEKDGDGLIATGGWIIGNTFNGNGINEYSTDRAYDGMLSLHLEDSGGEVYQSSSLTTLPQILECELYVPSTDLSTKRSYFSIQEGSSSWGYSTGASVLSRGTKWYVGYGGTEYATSKSLTVGWHKLTIKAKADGSADMYVDDILLSVSVPSATLDNSDNKVVIGTYEAGHHSYFDSIHVRKYIANEPTLSYGSEQYYADSLHYNASSPYNHTIESDGTITSNRTITAADDTNDTALSTGTSHLTINVYDNDAIIVRNFTFTGDDLDWYQAANLTGTYGLKNSNGIIETQSNGNFTTNLVAGTYWIEELFLNNQSFFANVISQQNTALQSINTSFGNIAPGTDFTDNRIMISFSLINSGNVNASVSAEFTTNYTTNYGLINGSDYITGSNLKLGNSTFNALTDNGDPTALTDVVPSDSTTLNYEAQLRLPAGQAALDYEGIVELTFSDV